MHPYIRTTNSPHLRITGNCDWRKHFKSRENWKDCCILEFYHAAQEYSSNTEAVEVTDGQQ